MGAALCCIAKNENNYIREWVIYHLSLGFCKIFIYDNNDLWGDILYDVLEDFINFDNVEIINCRGENAFHLNAYNDCYRNIGELFDWIAFLDVDEFLTFSKESQFLDINEYLMLIKEKGFNLVHINWMCFGDNNIITHNTYSVLERFTQPLDFNIKIDYDFPENNHIKSIIKGGLGNINIDSTHTPLSQSFKVCNGDGEQIIENSPFCPYSHKTIYIRHFVTKTISEYIQKVKKGRSDGYYAYPVNRFFLYNEKTPEKEFYISKYLESLNNPGLESFFNLSDPSISKDEKIRLLFKQVADLNAQLNVTRSSMSYRFVKLIMKPVSKIKRKLQVKQ